MLEFNETNYLNKRVDKKKAIKLFDIPPSLLFFIANSIREKRFKNETTFAVNRHINYSNVCINSCKFCAFKKNLNSKYKKRLSIEEIVKRVEELKEQKNLEVHITGGLDPQFTFEDAILLVKKIKEVNKNFIIKAFTMVELDFFSKTSGLKIEEIIYRLKESGVSIFPGGGAELFSERIRKKIAPTKISGKRWLEIAEKAHKIGVKTNATMLFGIGETREEIIEHLFEIRKLQDKYNGFLSFVPLLFQKDKTPFKRLKEASLTYQLSIYAISRIILDNIPHIKNHWVMSGLKALELSQWCGVDDIEGTVYEERIAHEAGAKTPTGLKKEELIYLIEKAQRIPVERDGLYNRIK